jgi:hypothetical protein
MISNKQNYCNVYMQYSILNQITNTHFILNKHYVISWRVNHRLLLTKLFTFYITKN